MNKQFWKGKNVLLTGHTGFKGSWLSIWLKMLDVELVGYSKDIPTKPSLYEIANVKDGITSIVGDVTDHNHLKKVIKSHQPDVIIHMAAQSLVGQSYINPVETYSTNVMGTVYLLDALRSENKTRVIINVTSDKCYKNKEISYGYKESDPMGGYDPYSSSKGCSELITSAFRNSFFNSSENEIALASVRAGNVIGGGDWAKDRLIPDIINSVLKQHKLKIRNPKAVRPWQYVLDPLNGYLQLVEKLWNDMRSFCEGWNFGPNEQDEKSVDWLVKKFSEIWGRPISWEQFSNFYPHEANYLRLDCSKAKKKLGWKQKLNLDSALKWTIDWYKHFIQKDDMRRFTEEQIKNFNLL